MLESQQGQVFRALDELEHIFFALVKSGIADGAAASEGPRGTAGPVHRASPSEEKTPKKAMTLTLDLFSLPTTGTEVYDGLCWRVDIVWCDDDVEEIVAVGGRCDKMLQQHLDVEQVHNQGRVFPR